jgi:hypothetical protein
LAERLAAGDEMGLPLQEPPTEPPTEPLTEPLPETPQGAHGRQEIPEAVGAPVTAVWRTERLSLLEARWLLHRAVLRRWKAERAPVGRTAAVAQLELLLFKVREPVLAG